MSGRAAAGTVGLRLLVTMVVLAGGGCLAWAGVHLPAPGSWISLAIVTGLVAVASSCTAPIVIRGQQGISVTAAGVLVAVALLPGSWAVISCAVGVAIGKAATRCGPTKTAFNAAKDTIGAAAALAVATAAGYVPGSAGAAVEVSGWAPVLLALLAAAAVYALVDELVPLPVVSLASGRPWHQVAFHGLTVRSVGRLADLALVVGVVAGVELDGRLVVIAPAGVLVAHLTYRHRLRVREERQAWRALLEAADTLAQAPATGELDTVLRAAAGRAAALFPGVDVEVEAGGRLVRADAAGFHTSRTSARLRAGAEAQVVAALASELDTGPPCGWLRLYFRAQPQWSAREQEQLRGLAAATAGAVRTCQAYAAAATAAADNAHHASHDPLTGLANRRRLYEHAAAVLTQRRGGYIALLLVDLDRFKEVNDTLGHTAGDQLLIEVAARLSTAAGDQLVARIGGDEFAVLLTAIPTPALVVHRGRQIVASLRGRVSIEGAPVDLAATGGIAIAGDHTDMPELYRRADLAMYQAKATNQPVRLGLYSRTRDWAAPQTTTSATTLASATHNLEVVYQPIVALDTARAVAAEAFIRWRHPEFGELPPGGALAVVERSGLLTEATNTLIDHAITAATSWHQAGFPLQLAINLSPRNLADPRFAPTLLSKMDKAGFHPRNLIVELNPTSTLGHLDATSPGLTILRDAGVQMALDDVAAEHARLSTLASMPVNQLKMDCSPVGGRDDAAPVALLCAIVELARRRNATVVAYGVTQDRQRELLWRHGCTLAQGSLFGRPYTAAELMRHLTRGYQAPGVLAPPITTGRRSSRGHRVHPLGRGRPHC